MISRCYNPKDTSYTAYSNAGIHVCQRWLHLVDFIEDAKKLPNWYAKIRNMRLFILDKDYYGQSKLYHPKTCSWITKNENRSYRKDSVPMIVQYEGQTLYFPSIGSILSYFATSTQSQLFKEYPNLSITPFQNNNYNIRKLHYTDQIGTVINEIKTNPNSRRLYLNFWHPGLLPFDNLSPQQNVAIGKQALPPCHVNVQFWVGNGRLSCQLYQRSCDVGLGVPFNIVQYSILTRMIAHVTGLEPGEFIWTGGDVHIYKNHMPQLTEQVMRDPYPSPQLELNPNVNSIDAFQYNDFKIINYNSHPRIKMEVSV
jgi:thymidylate synthase